MAERLAAGYLRGIGYEILHMNFAVHPVGEIDIIAEHGDTLVFFEVKSRRSDRLFAGIDGLVPAAKRRRIRRTASIYMAKSGKSRSICKIALLFVHISDQPYHHRYIIKYLE